MTRWWSRAGAAAALAAVATLALPAQDAQAHPLGDVTVNHHDGLRLYADRVELSAVVDHAEIPTLQLTPVLDRDGDGTVSPAEAQGGADAECAAVSGAVSLTVDGSEAAWTVVHAGLTTPPGEAGLATTRVECELRAEAALDRAAEVRFADSHLADRIGWREITATGAGVRLAGSTVPVESVSGQLRAYPVDLLADPLDVRSAVLRVEPGVGGGAGAGPSGFAPVTSWLGEVDRWFTRLVGGAELTAGVGVLAVALALVLGASHALLPGHGKTVMAAYLAGRRGTRRDALLVGATVTATHTAGVLVLGLLVSVSTAVAPDGVLRALAVVSGVLVAGVGVGLLRSAVRGEAAVAAGHGHGHGHGHRHGHGHGHDRRYGRAALVGLGVAGGLVPSPTALLVLLGAIGLGRSWFGVVLVLCYGLGMAATLTAAGLLLVGLRDRLERIRVPERLRRRAAGRTPVLTAALVLVVGLGIAVRGLAGAL
ncbi:High-affinity nickel-transporter [Pseudonocardia zijingensis]|uniref:ABC-type nickel/cobalt efflux system permease component RcnA n=1 Tax=Pseudonocardia zijingensis TaxID=153376 RepID=A0ABP3YR94_9PSEU